MSKKKHLQQKQPEEQFVLAPASVPQEQFLASSSTITLYHGSQGAGKTFAIILNLVKFAARKNSTIVYFRRTSPELRSQGGVFREATAVFRKMFPDVKVRDRDMEFYIPSTNSVVKFSSLQYASDVSKVLGSQNSVTVFDEATTFPFDEFILPLLGRMRNANVDYAPQMFWATNPEYDHGIYHWIKDFYLDENGIAIPERSNVERYFIMESSKPKWFDKYEDAEAYAKEKFPFDDIKPRSFRAIRAHVTQNIPLLRSNPDYLANLYAYPEMKRRKFLDGSWTAREESAGYFRREFSKIVPFPPMERCKRVRSYDQASVLPSTAQPDPDYTRGVLVSKTPDSIHTIEDIVSLRDRPHKVEQLILNTALSDPPGTIVVLSIDPGASGMAWAQGLKTKLAEIGVMCRLVKAQRGSKLVRFMPFAALAEGGFVQVVKSDWNEEMFEELERFSGERNNGHDDIADALSDAVYVLNQTKEFGNMEVPEISLAVDLAPRQPFHVTYGSNPVTFSIPTFKV